MDNQTTRSGRPGRDAGGPRRIDPADQAQLAESPVSWRRVAALFSPYRWQVLAVMTLLVISALVGLATQVLGVVDEANGVDPGKAEKGKKGKAAKPKAAGGFSFKSLLAKPAK